MIFLDFIKHQYQQTKKNNFVTIPHKLKVIAALPIAVVLLIFMRLIRPWVLIRIKQIECGRIGHFSVDTELYLCEKDAGINIPSIKYIDISYLCGNIANEQLAKMWRRHLMIWPTWLVGSIFRFNKLLPGGDIHIVGTNTNGDRDVHNLLEKFSSHLSFTKEEDEKGKRGLKNIGIPEGSEFICLIARDSAYLKKVAPDVNNDYHNYRDVDIQNFALAAETLANLGYYVLRMGTSVKTPMKTNHPKVIDYATNGMRNDFMDIYIGANCLFCASVGTGFDGIPIIFRRPIVYVDMLPVAYLFTFLKDAIFICKKHWLISKQRWLTLKEIFSFGVGFCSCSSCFESKGIEVIENTPEEIRDVVIEMLEHLKGDWQPEPEDDYLQNRFWGNYPLDSIDSYDNKPLHGKVRGRYGAKFLRDNREWLT